MGGLIYLAFHLVCSIISVWYIAKDCKESGTVFDDFAIFCVMGALFGPATLIGCAFGHYVQPSLKRRYNKWAGISDG